MKQCAQPDSLAGTGGGSGQGIARKPPRHLWQLKESAVWTEAHQRPDLACGWGHRHAPIPFDLPAMDLHVKPIPVFSGTVALSGCGLDEGDSGRGEADGVWVLAGATGGVESKPLNSGAVVSIPAGGP